MADLKLCYVSDCWAWFTSAPLNQQWGDDWDDIPYEHNAGDPYPWREGSDSAYSLCKVGWEGDFQTPAHRYFDSPFSVEQINSGLTPWLTDRKQISIMAGTSFEEFIRLIGLGGGRVYQWQGDE